MTGGPHIKKMLITIAAPTMAFSVLLFLFGIVAAVLIFSRSSRSKLSLPPGPKPWPLIGNVLDMPSLHAWHKYREWCNTHGEYVVNEVSQILRWYVQLDRV